MDNDQEKWKDEVLASLQGSKRAEPDEALFARIEQELAAEEVRVIPMTFLRVAAVAAVLILGLNILGLLQVSQNQSLAVNETVSTEEQTQLWLNYNLYE